MRQRPRPCPLHRFAVPLPLVGSLAAKTRSIKDSADAVVVLFAGQERGSGFLVSSDGLLLTDQHVVGDTPGGQGALVDGVETVGDVVASTSCAT